MRITVIDGFQSYVNNTPKTGIQRSSWFDARAFAHMGYDVKYIISGDYKDLDYSNIQSISVDNIGIKEKLYTQFDTSGLSSKATLSSRIAKEYFKKALPYLKDENYIFVHCYSTVGIRMINEAFTNKNIIFFFHDIIDLMYIRTISNAIREVRESKRNNVKFVTNSHYSTQRYHIISQRDFYDFNILPVNEAFDGYFKYMIWSTKKIEDMIPFIEKKDNHIITIGRLEPNKKHSRLLCYDPPSNYDIIHYGFVNKEKKESYQYYLNFKKKCEKTLNRKIVENLSDNELFSRAARAKTIILPCYHEGFGFTAFEMGIYGVVPVIFKKYDLLPKNYELGHATSEYFTRANALHFVAEYMDEKDIKEKIDQSLEVTTDQRIEMANNLLKYFTVENYVNERIEMFNSPNKILQSNIKVKNKKSVEDGTIISKKVKLSETLEEFLV